MTFDKLRDDNEAYARQKIDQRLRDANWRIVDTAEDALPLFKAEIKEKECL